MKGSRWIGIGLIAILLVAASVFGMKEYRRSQANSQMYGIRGTARNGALFFAVLSQLSSNQITSDLPQMIKASGVRAIASDLSLRDVGEYISAEALAGGGSGWGVSTNLSGRGGWYYDEKSKILRINTSNGFQLLDGSRSVTVGNEFLTVDTNGVHISLAQFSNDRVRSRLKEAEDWANDTLRMLIER